MIRKKCQQYARVLVGGKHFPEPSLEIGYLAEQHEKPYAHSEAEHLLPDRIGDGETQRS